MMNHPANNFKSLTLSTSVVLVAFPKTSLQTKLVDHPSSVVRYLRFSFSAESLNTLTLSVQVKFQGPFYI